VRSALLRWYRTHRRDLPWRDTDDPYAIWVSEVMLQQTQVATVIPYYERFLERFPDPASLARADEEEVLGMWSGLGYYRRARALRQGAIAVVERHGGRLPRDPRSLQALPGIGRYTAGAIASIAFDTPAPILDGNVRRVLSRLLAVGNERPPRAVERHLWDVAAALAEGPHPGDLNQALMELGALVCLPRKPRCDSCPLRSRCRGLAGGDPEAFPAVRPRPSTVRVRVAAALVERAGSVLVERPGDDNPLRGTWDLPAIEIGEDDDPDGRLRAYLRSRHGIDVAVRGPGGRASHGILNRRLRLEGRSCRLLRGRVAGSDRLRWLPLPPGDVAISAATRKLLPESRGRGT
jgi:A/G-specific adenine glycosylase